MSHCQNGVYCVFPRDCMCRCAGCNPLRPGQVTWDGFRKLLKKLKKERELTPDGYDEIIKVIDLEIADNPTDPKFIEEVVARQKMMDARRASGKCMAVSEDKDGNDIWCALDDMHEGPHKVKK